MISNEAFPRRPAWIRTVLVLLLATAAAAWLDGRLRRQLIRDQREAAFAELVPYGRSLGVSMMRRLSKLEALQGFALKGLSPGGTLTEEDFDSFAQALLVSLPGIHWVSIAPAGVQSFVYPVESNRSEVGRHLLDAPSPDRRALFEQALQTRQVVLSSPRKDADGVTRLAAWRAIYRDEVFLGFVSIEFEQEPLLREAGLLPLPAHLAVFIRDDSEATIHGEARAVEDEPVVYRFEAADGFWELQAVPTGGWASAIGPVMLVYRLGVASIAALLALITWMISSRHQRMSVEIERRTREISEANRALQERVREREAAEIALRESEERLSRTEAFSLIMAVHLTLDGEWLKIPPSFCELLGYDAGELLGRSFSEITHPDDVSVEMNQFERLRRGEAKTSDLKKRFVRKDGTIVWAYVNQSVVSDEEGRPLYFLVYLRDITREEIAREALQESEERYRRIFETSTDGLYVYASSGKMIDANPAACAMHGLTLEELLQHTPEELTHPEAHEELHRMAREVARGGEAHGVILGLRRDGSTFPIEMAAVPYSVRGESLGLCIVRDVSEQKRVERERLELLAEREDALNRLQMTMDSMPVGCVVMDAGMRITLWNPHAERIFGYAPHEAMDRTPPEFLVHESSREAVDFEHEHLKAGEPTGLSVVRNVTKDGRTILCQWTSTPLLDADGSFLGVIAMCQDITELEEQAIALRESEERYRSLVTAMTSIVWTSDTRGSLVSRQDSWEAYTGQGREAYAGFGWTDMIHPDDRDRLRARWDLSLKSGELYEIEARIWHQQSGEFRHTQVRAAPVYDDQDEIREWIGTVTDVHDRWLAEQALLESQERYRRIVETAGEGIWLTDREWNLAFVNDRLSEMLGYTSEELVGMNVESFVFPGDREKFTERQRSRERGESERYQANLQAKNGSEVCVLLSTRSLRDDDGAFLGSLAMVTDVTDRVLAERTLKESERRLATLMSHLPGMAYRCHVDAHWTLEFVSEGCEALTGYRPERLTNNPDLTFVKLIHPDDLHKMSSGVAAALKSRGVFRLVYRIHTASGEEKWVWEQGQGVFSPEGQLVALEGFIADITEQKQSEEEITRLNEELESRVIRRTEQLQQANRELEGFSYSVSHDLRAPLRGIDGFARILQDEYAAALPDEGRRYLKLVRNNAQQMGRLIDDLLNFSRLNRQPVRRVACDSAALVKECLESLGSEANGRELCVSVGDLPRVEADPALLRQVFVNLLSNAMKFTRRSEPARIEVGTLEHPDCGRVFFVRDNGVGFDMKYRDKLFGVFQRLHRAEDYEGTGVGLALIQRIIHRHNGEIWAEAEPGEGAVFYFTLGEGGPDE